MLIDIAQQAGHKDMANGFTAALQDEQRHLDMVRGWLRKAVPKEAA